MRLGTFSCHPCPFCHSLLLSPDRFKLSLLHRPGMAQTAPQQRVNFKDFSDDKAATKARKAAATSKGFGAAAAAAKQASTAAAAAADLSDEQLSAVLGCNAYGDDHLDGGLTSCRQEQQGSIIGKGGEHKQLPSSAVWCSGGPHAWHCHRNMFVCTPQHKGVYCSLRDPKKTPSCCISPAIAMLYLHHTP